MIEIEPGLRARIEPEFGVFWSRDETCEKHGPFEAMAFVPRATDTSERPTRWSTRCNYCSEEKEADRKRMEHEQKLRAQLDARVKSAGIPRRFRSATLDTYVATNPGQRYALEVSRNYARDFERNLRRGRGLLLLGNIGNGKTHLAVGIAYEAMEQGYSAMFTTAAEVIARLKTTWGQSNGGAEQEAMIQAFARVGLLILDEVGAMKCVGRERELMARILGIRHDEALPTIFTANLTPEELPEYVGEQVVSRLRESASAVVGFNWEDYRPMKGRMAA